MSEDLDWTTRRLDYEPPDIDTSKAHSARIYDYLLGGKDNYLPDREAAEELTKVLPSVPSAVRHNRLFMQRAARYLAVEEGISQFLDIGTGIPTSPNLHEITQQVNPAARVVYVDNDPIVLAHARARMISAPEGRVTYIRADLRDPEAILTAPELKATLDLSRPVALLFLCTLELAADASEARVLLRRYTAALAPGSFLVLSVGERSDTIPDVTDTVVSVLGSHGVPASPLTHAEVAALFDGLDLVEPGVVAVNRWRPDAGRAEDDDAAFNCGVARTP
jgi:S-adenosyl methyltransferase